MKLAIMQPYFFPYIGYFQLINSVDEFVVYDNIEYTKKGWINRNRILLNGKDSFITIPLKNESDFLNIKDRTLSEEWEKDRKKIFNKIFEAYRKSPYFDLIYPLIEKCIFYEENNLFKFILNSLSLIIEYLEINTPIIVSSTIPINNELKAEEKVIKIIKARKSDIYINPIGGSQLYFKDTFKKEGIDLFFIKTNDFKYKQYENDFIPYLSIIDVMMFNSKEEIKNYLNIFYTLM